MVRPLQSPVVWLEMTTPCHPTIARRLRLPPQIQAVIASLSANDPGGRPAVARWSVVRRLLALRQQTPEWRDPPRKRSEGKRSAPRGLAATLYPLGTKGNT